MAIQEEYSFYRYIVQRCIQSPVEHLKRSFFGKIANDYKLLANYRKYPILVRTEVEIFSDPNYFLCILFER